MEWDAPEFRHDGLEELQREELSQQRQALTEQWQDQQDRRRRDGGRRGEEDEGPSINVDEEVSMMETLPVCVGLLSQLPMRELQALRRLGMTREELQRLQGKSKKKGLASLQVYVDNEDGGGADGEEKGLGEMGREHAEAALALVKKKVGVFRSICSMRFVEETKRRMADRDKRINSDWIEVVTGGKGEGGKKWKKASEEEREAFFQRLRDDIDRRRKDLDAR